VLLNNKITLRKRKNYLIKEDFMGAGPGADKVSDEGTCKYCGNKVSRDERNNHWHPPNDFKIGTNLGDSGKLAKNILAGKEITKHPCFIKESGIPPEAHHLIPSAAMRDNNYWKKICKKFGYDINCRENGVFLPSEMMLACHLNKPLHRRGHSAGHGGGKEEDNVETKSYPKAVMKELDKIQKKIQQFECNKNKGKKIIKELNDLSSRIFNYVSEFTWTITYDGFDYKPKNKIGCSNCSSLLEKKNIFKKNLEEIEINHNRRGPLDYKEIKKANEQAKQKIFCEGDDGFGERNHSMTFGNQKYKLAISE
jgi:hypothetical protein